MPVYWAFRALEFKHEGWNVDGFHKVLRGIAADLGYWINEARCVIAFTREGQPAAYAFRWYLTNEPDYKYALKTIFVRLIMRPTMKPVPGSDPKNPKMASYGLIQINMDGVLVSDYLKLWADSPVLSLLLGVRERYFYISFIERWKQQMQHDADQIFAKSKAYLDYLPSIS